MGQTAMARHSFSTVVLLPSAVLILSVGLTGRAACQQSQTAPPNSPKDQKSSVDPLDDPLLKLKLRSLPAIRLLPRTPLAKEKVKLIKASIACLAELDSHEFCLPATFGGHAFLPLPGQRQRRAVNLTAHRLISSTAIQTLVEIGPEALPFLLNALDDKTPTELKFENRCGAGPGMWLDNELWGNPLNELEMKTLGPHKSVMKRIIEHMKGGKDIKSYTVKVGDVCLVAIGQIVGRGYQVVGNEPTNSMIINSPTEDSRLREQLRKIWASDDSTRTLMNSLLLDYATEGVSEGSSLDSWYFGSKLQIEAATRLLYYYPKETATLIAGRLRELDVKKVRGLGVGSHATESENNAWTRREVANAANTHEFVKAVSWCPEPEVREAIRAIFTRTGDVDVLLAALPSVDDRDRKLIAARLETYLDALPAQEEGVSGDGGHLVAALAERLGEDAAPAIARYLKNASAQRCHSAAAALQMTEGNWCVPILTGLLADKRPVGGYLYAIRHSDQDNRLPIRVCDVAAEALHAHRPELEFTLEGEYKDLDTQIEVIRGKMAGKRR
jgi:hypothetical protein